MKKHKEIKHPFGGVFLMPKGDKMLSTLILLYALDNGQTPNECFIAAWVFLILEIICAIVKEIGNLKNKD